MKADEPAYRQGMERWAQHLRRQGDEARPFDLVLGGIAALLKTTVMNVARRWHDPLASIDIKQSLTDVVRTMQFVGERWGSDPTTLSERSAAQSLPYYLLYELDRYSLDPTDPNFIQWRDAMIDREIKRAYPKVRRGTKEYKRLHASVIGQATRLETERRQRERSTIQAKIRAAVTERMGTVKAAMGRVGFLRLLARDIQILGGDPTNILASAAALQATATSFGRALARMRREAT